MPVTRDVPAVALDGVSFAYRGGPPVLEDVTLEVERGAFLGIAGPNGGGKTTLLRLVLGLERPSAGTVRLHGLSPREPSLEQAFHELTADSVEYGVTR